MTGRLDLLLVDDNPDDRRLVMREIRKVLPDSRIDEAGDEATLAEWLREGRAWDVVITDYQLRWSTGMDVFARLQAARPGVPVIMFTASGSEELAVAALKQGVDDYITKTPKHYGRVPYAVQASAERRRRRTEARDAATALQRSEALLKLALEAAKMETWEYRLDERRLLLHGRSGAVSGDGPRAIGRDALFDALSAEDAARVRSQFLAAIEEQGRFVSEFRLRTERGLRWLRAAAIADGTGRMVGVVEDITRRKRFEEQLEEAARQKDQFIATLGHELRNPLAPIRYATRLLQAGASPGQVERARTVIERQAAAMAQLLDQLLDQNRIARGQIELDRHVLDFAVLVRDALDDTRALAEANGQAIVLASTDTPVPVDGDGLRLKQVIDNLLQNALKFTPPGGRVDVVLAAEAGEAVLRLTDTGVGIAPDLLDTIFEPLVQADAGPAAVTRGGLGIGLSIVRQIARLHGGSVSAGSPGPGLGATFEVRLPLAQAEAPTTSQPVASTGPAPGAPALRIVVADDQPDAADTLAMMLGLYGHEVRTAYDGTQACTEAAQWQPDAMILDIGMPGATGDEVARWVRGQAWGARVRLVAVTG
ncbi:MAG TPA: response regulator, partial [Lysobacter sp.]